MNTPRPMLGPLHGQVIFVDGPLGSSAELTKAEMFAALSFIYVGGGVLRLLGEKWGAEQAPQNKNVCGFVFGSHTIRLTRDPATLDRTPATFDARDKLWLDDTFAALGFPNSPNKFDGARRFSRSLRAATFLSQRVADAFPILVTKYPCFHHGYQAGGVVIACWPRVLTESVSKDKPDRFFAHEIGHVFAGLDEYSGPTSPCATTEVDGPFSTPNTNCVNGNPASQPCMMRENAVVACPTTRLHWGWRDADKDGTPDLFAPGTITLPNERVGPPGSKVTIAGTNVWDARAVTFGNAVTDKIEVVDLNTIKVQVPAAASGIVQMTYLTRRGVVSGPIQDTFFFAGSLPVPAPAAPAVLGIQPSSAPPGTTVKVLGINLGAPTAVLFGSTPADLSTLVASAGGASFDIQVPNIAAGSVDVTVQTAQGSSAPFPPFSTFSSP